MPKLRFMPDDKRVDVRQGTTVLEAARRARVPVRSRCSGGLSCLMCKVRVTEGSGRLSEVGPAERAKLGSLEDECYRFACQAKVHGDATVELPEDPLKAAVRAQLARAREEQEGI